jgi:hypothetical protein
MKKVKTGLFGYDSVPELTTKNMGNPPQLSVHYSYDSIRQTV